MFRKSLMALACAVAMPAAANAAVEVNGVLGGTEGYTLTASVAQNASAPLGNFGTPTGENHAVAYNIYLTAQNGFVYGFIQAASAVPGLAFANLYWNINPQVGTSSDIAFGLNDTSASFFIPNCCAPAVTISGLTDIDVVATDSTLEFAIPNHYFMTVQPGAPTSATPLPGIGSNVTLNLSQSFGYSVAGGQTVYGSNRLGTVALAAAVPEPGTWAMMIGGFGLMGGLMRRRKGLGALATA